MYNIDKMRQISCRYALCLAEDVQEKGIDPAWCRAEKSYLTCTYVMGEIFAIFPLLSFYDKTVNTVKEWFENPLSILGAVSGCLCGGCGTLPPALDLCSNKSPLTPTQQVTGYVICILPKTAAKVLDAVASVKSTKEAGDITIGHSYCDEAEKNDVIRKLT
jgi:hypothetical protein